MDITQGLTLMPEQLDSIVQIIPIGAMIVNTSGHIISCNHELNKTLGYAANTLINKNIDELLPKEYQHSHHSLMQQYLKAPSKRQMGAGRELYALKSNGDKIPIEIGLTPVDVNNSTFVLATLLDISARIKAQHIFKESVEHAPYGLLVVSKQGKITYVNKAISRCFGFQKEELIGEKIEKLLPKRYSKNHQSLRNSYTQEPSIRMMGKGRDLTALHSDGREFPIEIGLQPINDENNQEVILVSLVDITERKRMEIELKKTNTNLEEFTYVASHDLRSPLRGIADLLEWIKEDLPVDCVPSINKNIERIAIRVNKMETLIENLLTYARAGNLRSEISTISISELIENILGLIEPPNTFAIKINTTVEIIESSITPIETILRNLISNAIKHHDKKAGTIEVSCHEDNNMFHFTVTDDGPGIPEKAKERVFKLFQSATSSERNSSGIGLSVCRRLATTHGGQIYLENNIEKSGATFHLWWPQFIRKDNHD